MSSFSDAWVGCMQGSGFPVPDVQTVNEAVEFIEEIHSAWENTGGDEQLLVGALITGGAIVGVDEAALAVLGAVAEVAVLTYLSACMSCLGSTAFDELKGLFAAGKLPAFVLSQLDTNGIDVRDEAPV